MRKAKKAYLGKSTGRPNQAFKIKKRQAINGRGIRLETNIDGLTESWEEVSDLTESGPEDRCYIIDEYTGDISFGDGVHGRIPQTGADISATYERDDHSGCNRQFQARAKCQIHKT